MSVLRSTGSPIGAAETALDTACGLYLGDPPNGPEPRRTYDRDH